MTNGETTASFVYNENGLRVQKTVNGVVTDYTLHGKNVVHMKRGNDELHFFYDAQNKPAVVVYNDTAYSYVKNLQGDIVAILNSAGTAVVNYVYDAWGRPISKSGSMAGTLGTVQPFRYRGYVYDEETGFYYLRSRYYCPTNGRFVNADIYPKGNGFTYCLNSPVVYADNDGFACVCCFDENGIETPLTVLSMGIGGGGGGGSTIIAAYSLAKNMPRYKAKLEDALYAAIEAGREALRHIQEAISWANRVMTDIVAALKSLVITSTTYTTEYMLDGGYWIGKIGVSSTKIVNSSADPGFLYIFFETNNLNNKYGIGINVRGRFGVQVGISEACNIFVNAQINPRVHCGVSLGLDGIGASIGFDYDKGSVDFELKAGLGLAMAAVLLYYGIPALPKIPPICPGTTFPLPA